MQIRHINLFLGILVIALLIFHCSSQQDTVALYQQKETSFDSRIRTLQSQKTQAEQTLKQLTASALTLKPWMDSRMQFDDPEKGLVKFLDFLAPKLLKDVNSTIAMNHQRSFEKTPIPLQKTGFQINFNFSYPHEAESFLNALLLQHDYPLRVNSANFNKGTDRRANGTISLDLLLPASLLTLTQNDLEEMGVL
ncbi:hypothetical protein [Desulfobacula phenolica]|uniref:Uncharacterized protein n=1 Tax=Desulfobacula phenolica TaxID=90732 RepID=A0A1H2J0J5_9BACT|nr:hypothetical protein [Desulfobacula phenolica]SDU49909.1 hypothetical protein SAMN04487931_11063 [Desulfobacula phenolica]